MEADKERMNIIQVGNVILSMDCLRQCFCCDLAVCKGCCCIEGEAGAPLTAKESRRIEKILPKIMKDLSPEAREVIRRQGVSYRDKDGDLVTSIVNGKDCVFTCYDKSGICLCAIQKAMNEGRIKVSKPISCSLYPIREKCFEGGLTGLNYNRWDVCWPARDKGKKLGIPVYRFLREPLVARFGEAWYEELDKTALKLKEEGYL